MTGFQPASRNVAIKNVMGTLTRHHFDFDIASFLYADDHAALTLACVLLALLAQRRTQDFTCASGMVILGSANPLTYRPVLNDHLSTDVAQAPAPIRPVASATLDLQVLTTLGAIPTVVCP